jgi:peptidoglycan/xylan/chitin deacetylase (PgdA/CDA1 family)
MRWFDADLPMVGADRETAIRQALKTYKTLPGRETSNFVADIADATGHATLPTHLGEDMWMTWNNVREMRLAGMTIGGHTVNHPLLARLSSAEQVAEIRGCHERLTEVLGFAPKAFSYPVGHRDTFTTVTRAILLSVGFEYAFSFYGGYQSLLDMDLLDLKRVNVGRRTSQAVFESMTSLPSVLARFA